MHIAIKFIASKTYEFRVDFFMTLPSYGVTRRKYTK
jgi:hypothetical protein